MKVAEQYDICTSFFDRLRQASSRLLLLDYDGTLAPFTPDRKRAFPYHDIPEIISRIMAADTRVVLISGRSARELLFLSGIHPQPEIWGSHGAERLFADGSYEVDAPDAEHRVALQTARRAFISAGLTDRIETKPGSIAVHWRGLSSAQQRGTEAEVRHICEPLVRQHGLELLRFDGGLEFRAPGKDKGDAVETILSESGQDVAAAYLGDDQTDENAFRAIKGRGLAVLVRLEPRSTRADVWLKPPEELIRFLRDWLRACGEER
ncbi:MAG TPA: trehalose-phosphatase [Terriglobales bacterium]|jgi:trehalose 6-phosphate phosphatase|nr:trehalose-phosphatase [Terriglobales bacterium]